MFFLWVFWKVCEAGVFELLFFRTQHTQFVTHDCQKNSTCNFAVIIYQVKDVRGRYLDKPNVVGCRHQYTGTTSLLDMS